IGGGKGSAPPVADRIAEPSPRAVVVREFHVGGGSAAAHGGPVHDVVLEQGERLDEFQRRGGAQCGGRLRAVVGAAPGTPAPPGEDRPDSLSAVEDEPGQPRSEEHTSELQSRENLVCRLLLEKRK